MQELVDIKHGMEQGQSVAVVYHPLWFCGCVNKARGANTDQYMWLFSGHGTSFFLTSTPKDTLSVSIWMACSIPNTVPRLSSCELLHFYWEISYWLINFWCPSQETTRKCLSWCLRVDCIWKKCLVAEIFCCRAPHASPPAHIWWLHRDSHADTHWCWLSRSHVRSDARCGRVRTFWGLLGDIMMMRV